MYRKQIIDLALLLDALMISTLGIGLALALSPAREKKPPSPILMHVCGHP